MKRLNRFIDALKTLFTGSETERLREARRTQERFALAIRASAIGLWDWNLEHNSVYLSPEYKAQIGYRDDEMESSFRAWESHLHPDDRQGVLAHLSSYVENPVGQFTAEYRLRHKDGTYRNLLSRAQCEFVEGRMAYMRGCDIDITATKMLEAQLRQAQKMEAVGRLAGGVAHDFNNLLTVINGYVEFLLEDNPAAALKSDLLEIQRAGKSAERLTRQLLVFSRTAKQKSSPTNVNQLIADWQRLLGRTLGDNIAVEIDLCEEQAVVDVDAEHIEQIIMNLAVNAKDAMPRGGALTLRTDAREIRAQEQTCVGPITAGRYVVISVKDTGTGIPADVLPHIFEPFFTTKEAGKGTGLGLATVNGVLADHAGGVGIHTSPQGTTFSLYFPVSKRVELTHDGASASQRQTPYPKHVLVIDDDVSVRQVIAREISAAGHRVEAGDVNYAFAALRDGRSFDVLVTDVVMPQISGVELSQHFRARLPTLHTIFTTGYADSEITSAFPPNAIVLRKPLSRRTLHSALDAATLPVPVSRGFAHAV